MRGTINYIFGVFVQVFSAEIFLRYRVMLCLYILLMKNVNQYFIVYFGKFVNIKKYFNDVVPIF